MKLPKLSIPIDFRPMQPALAHAGGVSSQQPKRGGTMLFASGGSGSGPDDDAYDGYDDEPVADDRAQATRRSPGAQRGGGSGSGGSGGGGGRQRSVQFQPEDRYWTEYLRIALPIIGLLLMIGLFWYWASQLTDDGNGGDDPESTLTPGTTEIITPPSTPEPTREQIVQSTPTAEQEEPTTAPEEPASTPEEEATEETSPEESGSAFAAGDFVVVVEGGVNMRSDPTTEGELVRTLEGGEVLEIQGDPVEADGYEWYEVIVSDTGEVGYVAAADLEGNPFIEPAE